MRRREFITLLAGATVWPLAARAQQPEQMRRIGVLESLAADDPESQPRRAAFEQGLQQLGWTVGRSAQIDYRWAGRNADDVRKYATELVALAPDVIFATNSLVVSALQQATRTTPIVFAAVIDPVGAGLVASLARPGGNATGFTIFEYGMGGKWLELLKDIAPRTTRAAVIRDPTNIAAVGQLGAIQVVAPSFGVEFPYRFFVKDGGLISYGPDLVDQYRRAAGYVDRILRGEKPADLPVQAPTKYDLVINLKTAKALRLEVPPMLLARADEVIE